MAKQRFPNKSFEILEAQAVGTIQQKFDRVLVWGVFHHMSCDDVGMCLRGLSNLLTPGGFCIVAEAVWPSNKLDLIGWLLRRMDAGKFVRTHSEWKELLSKHSKLDLYQPYYNRCLPCVLCRITF